MTRLHAFWDDLRGTFWFVPSAMVVSAVALSFGVIRLDEIVRGRALERLSWVYAGGPEGARAVLSAIAASMITVAGVTFSITIVALTLASQQFGPRLLRNFLRDRGNQVVLGTFIATYTYCLLVLRMVRGTDDTTFVPHLAVTVGVFLAMASLGVLIYFIHHVATSIQATQIIANVAGDLDDAIDHLFPERIGEAGPGDADAFATSDTAPPDARTREVRATETGYVQRIDGERLVAEARRQDLVVMVRAPPGTFVGKGQNLLAAGGGRPELDEGALRAAFVVGAERTGAQDVAFFIAQLVELCARALSPGINDPETARACIARLEVALARLARRRFPAPFRRDEDGALRVVAPPVTFAGLAEAAFDEISWYGRNSVLVTCRLLQALGGVASSAGRVEDETALLRLADRFAERALAEPLAGIDRARLEESHRLVRSRPVALERPSDSRLRG